MRNGLRILLLLGFTSCAFAQQPDCKGIQIFESKLPIYPPIARAAYMKGVFHFAVIVYPDGHSEVRFVDGPSKGAFQVFAVSGRDFLESRRYGWVTGGQHQSCSYTAEIEYRMLPEEVSSPNNFMRVTDLDLGHTLVEVKATLPTINTSVSTIR
ncbi:hypothetical protein [Occallatibacter savannae]|uniref:hypothetical protein n=2 Tax=Occallatibacter savannae TaxID=1002691 RepID=UPI00194DDE94|nr:hypothetical protein [Occallatibacter savannae]